MTDSESGPDRRRPAVTPPPIPQAAQTKLAPPLSETDEVRAILTDIGTPHRRLWQAVTLVGGLILIVALIAVMLDRDSDEVEVSPGVPTTEARLLGHLAAFTASDVTDRFELTSVGGSADGAVGLFHVSDRSDPSGALRTCAVSPDEVSCPVDPSEYAAVLTDMGLRPSADPLDDAQWVEVAAWILGLESTQVYRGDPVYGDPAPTTVVLALRPAPLPGLDGEGLSATARAALDSLRPGDGLVVLGERANVWTPMLIVEDTRDWLAAESQLTSLAWPPTSGAAVHSMVDLSGRHLHLVAVLAESGSSELEVEDVLSATVAAPSDLGMTAVTVGGPPTEAVIRAVFLADGRIYELPDANGLAEVTGREVARLAGCLAPLAPPLVEHRQDGSVTVRLSAPAEGGWRRHALRVSARGAVTDLAIRRWSGDVCSAPDPAAPVPNLDEGEWLAGSLTSADPTGPEGRPIDRVHLSLDESRRIELEVESDSFQPHLSVRTAEEAAAPLAVDSGQERAHVELDLPAGQYSATIQATDGSTGSYRIVARDSSQRQRERVAPRTASEPRDDSIAASEQTTDRQTTERPTTPTAAAEMALSDSDLRSTMRPHIGDMRECAGSYRGAVSLRFTVARGGEVREASAEADGLPAEAAECLRDLVRRVHFSGYAGPLVEANYYVIF